jgi:DNA polymerase-1
VQTEPELHAMRDLLTQCTDIVYDSETSGLNPRMGARIIGHGLAAVTEPNVVTAWYIPVRHVGGENLAQRQLDPRLVAEALRLVLAGPGRCGLHHAKFDVAQLRADGVPLLRDIEDTSIDATIDNENERSFSLKSLAAKYCLESARDEEQALEDWMRADARKLGIPYRKRKRGDGSETLEDPSYLERFGFARTPLHLCGAYACRDVFYTLYLWLVKYSHVRKQWPELWEREHRVGQILHKMEWAGLPVDEQLIRDSHDLAREEVEYWLAECKRLSGRSGFQGTDGELRRLFYEELQMRPLRFTKGGKSNNKLPSVDKVARKLLAKKYPRHKPLLEATMKLARARKLHGTYTGSFLRFLSPDTKRIHPSYNQLERKAEGGIPVTGRLSSADPNIQNVDKQPLHLHQCRCEECVRAMTGATLVPVGAPAIIEVHRYFTAPEGFIRFYLDFSQIELRTLAWLCQDPVLLHAYANDLDLHQLVATQLGIKRAVAKQANFLTVYGGSQKALGLKLPGYYDDPDGTEAFAERVLQAYFRRYARILEFRDSFARSMRRNRNMFVSSFGRPRRIPTISAHQRWARERAERMMMSSIVSGTAADIMKESMIRCDDILVARNDGSEQVQSIHDELVFDTPLRPGWANLLIQLVRAMEDWPQFSQPADGRRGVPIKVNAAVTTTTWKAKREVEVLDNGELRWAS